MLSNRLQYETSPYLLQHKENPVDSEKYMAAIKLYENAVIMGYNASILYFDEKQDSFIGAIFDYDDLERYKNDAKLEKGNQLKIFNDFRAENVEEYNAIYGIEAE